MESNWRWNVWEQGQPDVILNVPLRLLARVNQGPITGAWIGNGIWPNSIPLFLDDPFTGQLTFQSNIGVPGNQPHFPYGLSVDPD